MPVDLEHTAYFWGTAVGKKPAIPLGVYYKVLFSSAMFQEGFKEAYWGYRNHRKMCKTLRIVETEFQMTLLTHPWYTGVVEG